LTLSDPLGILCTQQTFWSSTLAISERRSSPGDHAAKVPPMIAVGFGFLALFSILSIMLGSEDPRRADPRDDVRFWMRFGIR
jgi:hypothetical protein